MSGEPRTKGEAVTRRIRRPITSALRLAAVVSATAVAACVGAEPTPEPPSSVGPGGSGSGGTTGSSSTSTSVDCTANGMACTASVTSAAIPECANYVRAGILGNGGYTYTVADTGGSTICAPPTAMCVAGTTGATTAANATTTWGTAFGIILNQPQQASSQKTYAVSGSGISYSLSNLPSQGARLDIDNSGTEYCAPISSPTGSVTWSEFSTTCWNTTGTHLSGAPATATHVEVVVVADSTATPYDFCVTSIGFTP